MGLSRGEGSPGQSKAHGGEKELRLWGEPDLGSSLALPLKHEILGKLLSLSEPRFFKSISGV